MKYHLLSLAPIELLYPSEIHTYLHTGLSNPIFFSFFDFKKVIKSHFLDMLQKHFMPEIKSRIAQTSHIGDAT